MPTRLGPRPARRRTPLLVAVRAVVCRADRVLRPTGLAGVGAALALAAGAPPAAAVSNVDLGGVTEDPVIRLSWAPAGVQPAGDLDSDGTADAVAGGTLVFGAPGATAYDLGGGEGRTQTVGAADARSGAGGDVDGDGLDDVVVSDDDGVRVVPGPGTGLPRPLGVRGSAVDVVPDLDGDGLADVVVGAPDEGRVHVVLADRTVAFTGPPGAGTSVAGLGDVNGDGFGDLAVGGGASGRVWVVFGRASLPPVALTALGARGFVITGTGIGGQVAGPGDVNGDGRADVLLAAGPERGYLVHGRTSTSPVAVGAAGAHGLRFDGGGATVAAPGDVNGDGLADVVLGAPQRNRVVVVFGRRATSTAPVVLTALGARGFWVQGAEAGFGHAGAYGDLDDDGRPDVGGPGAAVGIPCDVRGSAMPDVLTGTSAPEVVCAGAGDDVLAGGEGDDVLLGGPGADRLDGQAGVDVVSGGAGADRLTGGPGADVLEGGAGPDLADYALSPARVTVTLDDRASDGSGERDDVRRTVEAVTGSRFNDTLVGGPGADRLDGGPGADRLDGLAGDDALAGADGNDTVLAGPGADVVDGGPGLDTVTYAPRRAPVAVSLDGVAQDGEDLDRDGLAEEGDDVRPTVEDVLGGTAGDLLVGADAANRLDGSAGNDRLDGGPGKDRLLGRAGDDVLLEGPAANGRDLVDGGPGRDTADYSARTEPLRIDLDGAYDDGEAGEADSVLATVEVLLGGAGADALTATGSPVATVRSGGEDDTVTVADRRVDEVDCGPGTGDTVTADAAERRLDGCERRPGLPNATVVVDADSLGGPCDDARTLAAVSVTAPVCTLGRGMELVPAGGVVVFRAGDYPLVTVTGAGTRTTTYEAFDGEQPSIHGITASATAAGHRFEGFLVRDITQLLGTRLELVGNELTPHGVVLQGADNLVEDNDIHDLTMHFDPDPALHRVRCHAGWMTVARGGDNPDADGDGVGDIPLTETGGIAPRCGYALRIKGDRHVVRGNRIRNIPADGIQAFPTSHLVIEGNTFEHLFPFVDVLEHSEGIQLVGTNRDVVIRNNSFYDTRGILVMVYPARKDVPETWPDGVTITGNTGYNDRNLPEIGNGCMALSAGTGMLVAGNTCWARDGVSPGGGIRVFKDRDRGRLEVTVRDNVSRDMRISVSEGVSEDHNLIAGFRGFTPGPHTVLGFPTFAGDERDLRLAPGSLGIDIGSPAGAGTDGACRTRVPGGGAGLVDVGAHEHGGLPGRCPWAPGGWAP